MPGGAADRRDGPIGVRGREGVAEGEEREHGWRCGEFREGSPRRRGCERREGGLGGRSRERFEVAGASFRVTDGTALSSWFQTALTFRLLLKMTVGKLCERNLSFFGNFTPKRVTNFIETKKNTSNRGRTDM